MRSRWMRHSLATLAAAVFGVGTLAAASPATAAEQTTAAPSAITCKTLDTPSGNALEICHHGGDEPRDIPLGQPLWTYPQFTATASLEPAVTARIKCYGDGVSGMRVQAVYAVPPGVAANPARIAQIRGYAAQMQTEVSASAAETSGVRNIRFVTSPYDPAGCDLDVMQVQLTSPYTNLDSPNFDPFEETIIDMIELGHYRQDRIYVMWVESSVVCGTGTLWDNDDRPSSLNANSYGPRFTRVDVPCFGIAETHELGHNVGAVQPSAPHSTGAGAHCTDEYDVMCYNDGAGFSMDFSNAGPGGNCQGTGDITQPGGSGGGTGHNRRYDCNHDDYFHTNPTGSNYLVNHWNTANHPVFAQVDSTGSAGRGAYHPLANPVRVADSRFANRGLIWDIGGVTAIAPTDPDIMNNSSAIWASGRLAAGKNYVAKVTGFDESTGTLQTPQQPFQAVATNLGVPNVGVDAVVLNVTVVDPSTSGFLSIRPYDFDLFEEEPLVSSINYIAGQIIPNSVTVTVPASGLIDIYASAGRPFVIIDVAGWYADGSGSFTTKGSYHELTPRRLMDTRFGQGGFTFVPNSTTTLTVTNTDVPLTHAAAVVLNVTATDATTSSFLTVWPTGQARPNASNLNFVKGPAVANLVIAGVGANGRINIFNELGTTNVIVDLLGWFDSGQPTAPAGATYRAISPARSVDTRSSNAPALASNASRSFAMRVGAVPDIAGVRSVVANVAAVDGTIGGYLSVYPSGATLPDTSTVNFPPRSNRANATFITLGSDGRANVYNEVGNTHALIDIAGYFINAA